MKYNTNYGKEDYAFVMQLRAQGLGVGRIYKEIILKGKVITKGAISRWIYRNGKPTQQRINKIKVDSPKLTESKAYLFGVLCGDGYITTGYRIGLDVCDLDFAEKFKQVIFDVYRINCKIIERKRDKTNYGPSKKQYSVVLSSKLAWLDLLKYSTFKTQTWVVPKEVLESKKLVIKSAFIKGIFDSEGTIRLRRNGYAYLQVCSGNNNSLLVIKDILKADFDIDMKIKFNKNVMVLHTSKYSNIKNYADKIGFVINRKQQLLNYALSTYKRTNLKHYNEEFKRKALDLYYKGYGPRKIGRMLGFSHTNIYDFIKQAKSKKQSSW